jgi:hypothetical protein
MSEQLTGVEGRKSEEAISQQQSRLLSLGKLVLASFGAMLLLGIEGVFAFCVCGDGLCNVPFAADACVPAETSETCPEDCGAPPPREVTLTVWLFVLPEGRLVTGLPEGLFNVHVGNQTLRTFLRHNQTTGPHNLRISPNDKMRQTAAGSTSLESYRTSFCGGCSNSGAIAQGTNQKCTITNLRLPTPPPATGCSSECTSALFRCSQAGEPGEICREAYYYCKNNCDIPFAHRLSVARYFRPGLPSVTLDEDSADLNFYAMSDVLRRDAELAPPDIDCNAAFCRDGPVTDYAIGDGIIDTEAELREVFSLPQTIKVARGVEFCKGKYDPLVGGCGIRGSFIVEPLPDRIAGLVGELWAHEYGHSVGLPHRDDFNAVMYKSLSRNSYAVNLSECMAYREGILDLPIDVVAQEVASAPLAGAEAASTKSVRNFVRQFFIEGIPYEEFARYNASAVPTLLEMLADPREEQAWPNIVIMLGMLGDERAVARLISFAEQTPDKELSYFQYEAKKNAIFGLGYLVNRTGNRRALTYLMGGLNPASWSRRGITWTSPEKATATERDRELSRVAIIALGLSGDPLAEEALAHLLTSTSIAAGMMDFREQMSGVISEALKANQRIAKEGLARYYGGPTP